MRRIYLDYNATCPIRPEVISAVADVMAHTGNASSIHGAGREARKIVEDARADIAAFVNVRSAQVIFNAGATEGNNTILSGYRNATVLMSAIEHPSVTEAAPHARKIPVTRSGVVDLDQFAAMVRTMDGGLVCVQLVNSETGVIQPIAQIAAIANEHGLRVHCDAVQAAGRMAIDFKALGVDTLTLSAHKFGGPQGVGALVFREGLLLPKLMLGGGQEKRQRAGTENVAGIAGFAAATRLAAAEIDAYQTRTKPFQETLERGLLEIANDIVIAGADAPRVTNTTCALLPRTSAETQLMAMDLEGVSVSSGSACSSGTFKPSHVLESMGFGAEGAKSALRFSTGWATTADDIDAALTAYKRVVNRIRT